MKKLLIISICLQFGIVFSQEEEGKQEIIAEASQLVADGNELLIKDGNFPKAEGEYRKAIAKNPVDVIAKYNLANAYYDSEKYDEATLRYTEAVKVAETKLEKHKAFHNQGNTFMEQKKYKEAVEAYKNALRNNPKDDETRYNLALAKKMLEEEKQKEDQNKDNKDNKDKNEDNKDQEGENEDKKEGEDKKEKDKKDGEDDKDKKDGEGDKDKSGGEDEKDKKGDKGEDKNEDEEGKGKPENDKKDGEGKPEGQPQQVEGKLSPQQVKNLLEAMSNQEKKVQDKVNAKKIQGVKTNAEKDW